MGNGEFYRARILQIAQHQLNLHQIHIVFVDSGSSKRTKSNYLRPLQLQFAQLPAQVIPCSLDRVIPLVDKDYKQPSSRSSNIRELATERLCLLLNPNNISSIFVSVIVYSKDCIFIMNVQLIDNFFLKDKQLSSSPLTDFADSGVVSRITPLSSINDNKLNTNHSDDDNESIATEHQCLSFNITEISKPKLRYKKCDEYMQYSNCLITYLDHPSAIFIQITKDAPSFQQMHQDLNRYYMDHLNAYTNISTNVFEIGNFCAAYSSRYFEFFRARILNIDHTNQQCLIIYVDFGNSEWIHIKGIRPLHAEFAKLEIQSIPVTLSHILPKKDLKTGSIRWDTTIGKQCTRKLRRLVIKPENEPFLFVSVTFLSNETWWSLPFVDIKIDGQDLAEILHNDGFARLTRNNKDLRMIYPNFGNHPSEYLIFGIQSSEPFRNRYP